MSEHLERRKQDDRINIIQDKIMLIESRVNEIYVKQNDSTIPSLKAIFAALNGGNGDLGVMREHEIIKEKVCQLEKTNSTAALWISANVILVIFAIITFAFGYGQLNTKVDHLTQAIHSDFK